LNIRLPYFGVAVVCGMLLFAGLAFAQVAAKPLSPQEEVLTYFYKDPRTERLIGFLERYEQSAAGQNWAAYPPVAGLFAYVFRAHPGDIERLIPERFNAKVAETIAAALRLSGNEAMMKKFQTGFQQAGRDAKLAAEFSNLPSRLEDLRILNGTHLDILWGASFASSGPRFVQMIADFFAQTANRSELVALDVAGTALAMMGGPKGPDLRAKYGDEGGRQIIYAAAALWALQSNSRQHVFVDRLVGKYIQDHPGTPATKALSALRSRGKPI
jgi:hypothetical protein